MNTTEAINPVVKTISILPEFDLPPCPFCGKEASSLSYLQESFAVSCIGCGTFGPRSHGATIAINLWSHRPKATRPRDKTTTNQVVGTPWEFIDAVKAKFGNLFCDLAATAENTKCPEYFITEEQDSLVTPWPTAPDEEYNWLNPPFANIAPWVEKCATDDNNVLVLVPALVGSEWYTKFVAGVADIYFLSPRLVFEGSKDPYPKDLMLLQYRRKSAKPFYSIGNWRWKP